MDKKPLGTCDECGKPVLPGEPRYAACEPESLRYWDCHESRRAAYEEAVRKFPETLARARAALARLRGDIDKFRR